MGDVVSLNRARKERAKAAASVQAAANRLRFGRIKAEKARSTADRERRDRLLDDARREADMPDGG